MKPRQLLNSDMAAFELLTDYYEDWRCNQTYDLDQTAVFRVITQVISGARFEGVSEELKKHAFDILLDVWHHICREDHRLYQRTQLRLSELIFKEAGWKRLLEEDEPYLLAAMLIGLDVRGIKLLEPEIINFMQTTFKEWTGAHINVLEDEYEEHAARRLFGDTWPLLYSTEIKESLPRLYNVLKQTTPKFEFGNHKSMDTPDVSVNIPNNISL